MYKNVSKIQKYNYYRYKMKQYFTGIFKAAIGYGISTVYRYPTLIIFQIHNQVETFGHFSVAIIGSASEIRVSFLCLLWVSLGSALGLLGVSSGSDIAFILCTSYIFLLTCTFDFPGFFLSDYSILFATIHSIVLLCHQISGFSVL